MAGLADLPNVLVCHQNDKLRYIQCDELQKTKTALHNTHLSKRNLEYISLDKTYKIIVNNDKDKVKNYGCKSDINETLQKIASRSDFNIPVNSGEQIH